MENFYNPGDPDNDIKVKFVKCNVRFCYNAALVMIELRAFGHPIGFNEGKKTLLLESRNKVCFVAFI